MYHIKVIDSVSIKELRERLGIDDNLSTTAKQVAMVWEYVAKKDNDWLKKCMKHEVKGSKPR